MILPLRIRVLGSVSLAAITAVLASCGSSGARGSGAAPTGNRASTVRVLFDDGTPYARPGLRTFVDDELAGVTDANGELRVELAAGARTLRVVDPGFSTAVLDVTVGQQPEAFELMMLGRTDRLAALACPQAVGGVLPQSATTFELAVSSVPTGKPVQLADFAVRIADASAADPEGGIDVSGLFTSGAAAGRLVVADAAAFFAAADGIANAVRITVSGKDADGASFEPELDVFLGRHALDLSLAAPPSAPSLGVVGLSVSARLIGTDVLRTAVTDGLGRVRFESLPTGTYEVKAATSAGAAAYSAVVAQFVNGDVFVGLRLLGLQDVLNGVPPTTVYQDEGFVTRVRPHGAVSMPTTAASAVGGNAISVTSGQQGQVVTNSTTFTAPPFTSTVKLAFEVVSAEYPVYVLSASEFNDNWTLRVLGPNGENLDSYVRNVNSQVTVDPTWIPGTSPGRTGEIVKELDVAALTAGQPAALTLAISATNIGDSAFPTSVTASLQLTEFEIVSIKASDVTPDYSCGSHDYDQTVQDQFSIPYANEVNSAQRSLFLELAGKPQGAQITRIKVDLMVAGTSQVLATVVDAAPSSTGRVRPFGPTTDDRFEALVTFEPGLRSPVAAALVPPADKIEYAVTVEAVDGGNNLMAQRRSRVYGALWQAEVGERTGCEEIGGDQWAARATVNWLGSNRGLLGAINDISGEHDRNLGHVSHQAGRAIDFRQYTTSDFASTSGLGIYLKLAKAVQDAANGDTLAATRVADWFSFNRAQMEPLLALASVEEFFVAKSSAEAPAGSLGVGLPANWFYLLLTQGSIAVGDTTLDLGIGVWASPAAAKVRPVKGHLNHYHVDLDL